MNLDGWITRRLTAATINAPRRHDGARSAVRRPGLPDWLAIALSHDRWLTVLAIEILKWVEVSTTAEGGTWPLSTWGELRAKITGDHCGDDTLVVSDVQTVLTAMRQRRIWYAYFVERPLARKRAPGLPAPRVDVRSIGERRSPALPGGDEMDDDRLSHLAVTAVAVIEAQLWQGRDPRSVVAQVLHMVFGGGTGAGDSSRPSDTASNEHERVAALADPAAIDRITAMFLDVLDESL